MFYFIGIDVSKDSFSYAICDENSKIMKTESLKMNREDFEKFKLTLNDFQNYSIAMESTSSYHINLFSFLLTFCENTFVVNPNLIKNFSQSISLRKTKTDEVDSVNIAKFLIKNHSNLKQSIINDDLKTIARLRESIVQEENKLKTKIKQLVNLLFPELLKYNLFTISMLKILETFPSAKAVRKIKDIRELKKCISSTKGRKPNYSAKEIKELAKNSIGTADKHSERTLVFYVQHLKFLDKELKEITEELIESVEEQSKNQVDIMCSIKGVSEVTASHFLAEIKDINLFKSAKQLIAYAGTDPSISQSGNSIKHGRISKKGVSHLRRIGFIIANCIIKHDSVFRDYFKKKRENKPYKVAVIATWNKFLRVIFAMLKNNTKFESSKTVLTI